MWGAWAMGMAAADAATLQRFERLGMGSIMPIVGLTALASILASPSREAQARHTGSTKLGECLQLHI